MSDSTILVKSPDGWKIKATLGLGFLALIVILAFLYHFQVGVGVLVVGLGIGARVCVWAWHQYNLADHHKNLAILERRFKLAEVTIKEYEAARARLMCHFLEFDTGLIHVKHPDEIVEVKKFYPALRASQPFADAPALLPEPEPRLRRLLDVDFIHMLIVGATNTGKTTVANWLIEDEVPDAAIYVLDPHNKFNIWPARVSEVIGTGRNYAAIDARLVELIGEMDRRYNSDVLRFTKILIVCDEWLSVLENCPSARRFFDTIGAEARKVNMSLIISTTSATADDLNCTAATRDNLVQLTLNRTLKDRNQGELKWSRKDTELVELPGKYRAAFLPARAIISASHDLGAPEGVTPLGTEPMPVVEEAVEPVPELDAGPVAPVPDATELRIYELHQQGLSLRAIYTEVYGRPYGGGREVQELRAILGKFGVKFDVAE